MDKLFDILYRSFLINKTGKICCKNEKHYYRFEDLDWEKSGFVRISIGSKPLKKGIRKNWILPGIPMFLREHLNFLGKIRQNEQVLHIMMGGR
ncbi:MAG: hypothetical protein WAN78_01190 [Methanoregula sp.]